jgi:hypothetical protein
MLQYRALPHDLTYYERRAFPVRIRTSAGALLLVFSLVSLGYALHTTFRDLHKTGGDAKVLSSPGDPPRVYVLYLHGNAKCITCEDILDRTTETLHSVFQEHLEDKNVIYREINVDLPENREYAATFEYFATSVVLALYEGGELRSWKNLDKVWDFADKPSAFDPYFTEELTAMLAKGGFTP